jgi:hypothetical protein
MSNEKCESCGLIQGHGNGCYATILIKKLVALDYVLERAKILVNAPTDLAQLVAIGKLKDAIAQVDRIEQRESVKV